MTQQQLPLTHHTALWHRQYSNRGCPHRPNFIVQRIQQDSHSFLAKYQLWLLHSHFYLDQSHAQLLSQLFAGDGAPVLNLWIFLPSSPFHVYGLVLLSCMLILLVPWRILQSPVTKTVFFFFLTFSFRKMVAHSWVLIYTACYNREVEWMTSGCCLTPKGIRVTLQLFGCHRVIILCFSLSVMQHNKRARCIIVFGVFVSDLTNWWCLCIT